jgi:HEXXH motif-containing protein
MDNLYNDIQSSLADSQIVPWLPDLTDALVQHGWKMLHRQTGITSLDYGTARVLAGNADATCRVIARLSVCPDVEGLMPQMRVECLTENWARRYQHVGLTFYTSDNIAHTAVLDCLQDAINLLTHVPTLQKTVARLVRACHLLILQDDNYDVSHSDPQVPFSIFVSIPQTRGTNEALRIVESIVHEAMHLQLTLIERLVPLVHPCDHTYFSPWKGEYRSPQGVLHALYVFRVIDRFLERLLALPAWPVASVEHMRQRRCDIAQQVREIETFKDCPALTALGTRFVRRLISE